VYIVHKCAYDIQLHLTFFSYSIIHRVFDLYCVVFTYLLHSLIQAVELGWIPIDWHSNTTQHEIKHACDAVLHSKNKLPTNAHRPLHSVALTLYACLFAVFMCIALVVVYFKHNVHGAYSSYKAQREGYEVVPDSSSASEEP